jgi:hypothetical protein
MSNSTAVYFAAIYTAMYVLYTYVKFNLCGRFCSNSHDTACLIVFEVVISSETCMLLCIEKHVLLATVIVRKM